MQFERGIADPANVTPNGILWYNGIISRHFFENRQPKRAPLLIIAVHKKHRFVKKP